MMMPKPTPTRAARRKASSNLIIVWNAWMGRIPSAASRMKAAMIVSTVEKSFCENGPKSEKACQAAATTTKGMASSMNAVSVRRMLGE
jgi:hypothetical protein